MKTTIVFSNILEFVPRVAFQFFAGIILIEHWVTSTLQMYSFLTRMTGMGADGAASPPKFGKECIASRLG